MFKERSTHIPKYPANTHASSLYLTKNDASRVPLSMIICKIHVHVHWNLLTLYIFP